MSAFVFQKQISYYETDAMGVVHHSNYVKIFEDARVAWMRERGIMAFHSPEGPYTFAVVKLETNFHRPARFNDEISVYLRMRQQGIRLEFEYAVYMSKAQLLLADGRTILVPVDQALKPVRIEPALRAAFQAEPPWENDWSPHRM